MTSPDEKDAREIEALRHNFEQELVRRNHLRAQILVSEGFTKGATEQEVFDFLTVGDEYISRLVKSPEIDVLAANFHFSLPVEEGEELQEYYKILLLDYIMSLSIRLP